MKKQFVVALAILVGTFSFAQKKELKTAEKAIKSGNFADAKSALLSAESLLGAADEKTKAKYYFLMGQAQYANGTGSNDDVAGAIQSFDKVAEIEGPKGKYNAQIEELKTQMLNNFLTKANASIQSKDYKKSSVYFDNAYRMSPKDTIYLYYAASTAVTAKEYDTSLGYYEELRDLGFTGISMQYKATNKESGEVETFDSKSMRDISVRAGTHNAPKESKSDSKYAEIVKNIALIHVTNGDDAKAVEAMQEARRQNPDDLGLLLSEANVQLKMGNRDRFKELMQEATEKDPKNAELQYNLGVISAEAGDNEAAKKHYERAIELDPSYTLAYNNMAVLLLSTEKDIVEEMNSLGTSSADNKRYDELKAQRTQIYESAIPYLETTLKLKPKDVQAATTLMNIYSAIGQTDKFKEMKAKVEQMQSGN
ncbi:tetratricopeptide repeat protein [Psychroserpens sp.]|uniref:tetratricopeptide repeat protein n=1 Tax=Psychroserpens sp. TaxID=2020870 RepID=UPI001B14AF3D|nr:tetratricopeptide repeat protein [Psychroserpens sp.]MBO6607097.1 tetratricopeptide repeat protein [Psychroserpens sp.]MBO6631276.1 tetratricopeptide repeat protein [Psychroserpens sp.]MBO6654243.1 tetratricopeptide repeat protein [Psychroserpens sp.]MBO6682471.1 tetratricopeptide repeat protein [Psychroserpens sp.]MBO6750869.1 tetratricopeptide repeat protein [Psychroserpens sp.]